MAIRTAQVEWTGDFKNGQGTFRPGSNAFTADYCYESIAGDGPGTNPTEMLASALAGCVSSTLAWGLSAGGYQSNRICTNARAYLEKTDKDFAVTRIDLHVQGEVIGIDEATFVRYVERITKSCPIGKALSSVDIIISAELLG
ncbi:MAG: OsmC family peroxiredoxin [Armatimonadota bacterium]